VKDLLGLLTILAVYLPPKYTVKQKQLDFYNTLGHQFIAGNYNAKHTDWGSRLITPRGREVLKMMERNNLKLLSMGEPTYWPSDMNNLPDLVDLCVTKGILQDLAVAKSCFDLSNHSPVLFTLTSHVLNQGKQPRLSNRHTNGDDFRHLIKKEVGTDYEHKHRNNSIGTKMIASKHSCKVLHQQNPPTIPCGRWPRK
jgi:hypothetical protein